MGALSSILLGISRDKQLGSGGDSQGTGLAGQILGHSRYAWLCRYSLYMHSLRMGHSVAV